MTQGTPHRTLGEPAWPAEELEDVPLCPVCQCDERTLMHAALEDWSFSVAPGQWSMWRCRRCRSGWLDPRPTLATIGRAYEHYYTHEAVELSESKGVLKRIRNGLGNDYRNARFGTKHSPSLRGGRWLARLLPRLRRTADLGYRFLPKSEPGRSMRVLDIGCGSGAWLKLARDAGWQVAGSDPDEVAAGMARRDGIEVRPFASDWLDSEGGFDAVTSNHSIEHAHDPVGLLGTAYDLLNPGGLLFIETPNIDAVGHDLYGPYWRGLEAPRHLVLFNAGTLVACLRQAGFTRVRLRGRPSPLPGLAAESQQAAAAARRSSGATSSSTPPPLRPWHRLTPYFSPGKSEFLTITARKD